MDRWGMDSESGGSGAFRCTECWKHGSEKCPTHIIRDLQNHLVLQIQALRHIQNQVMSWIRWSHKILGYFLGLFKKINLFFYWRIIALQNFVVFCQTSTWITHRYTYIPSLLNLLLRGMSTYHVPHRYFAWVHAILTTMDRVVILISVLQNEKINTLSQVPKL